VSFKGHNHGLCRKCGKIHSGKNKNTDLTGQRFGRLVVVSSAGKDSKHSRLWLCDCDCGNQKTATTTDLRTGVTTSCNCYRWGGNPRRKPSGEAVFMEIYRDYSRGSHEFRLSINEFRRLTKQDCYYCGAAPHRVREYKGLNGPYVYNGVDRMDNTQGYVPGNCVACCWLCNRMKRTMSTDEFLAHVSKIHERAKR